MPEFLRTPFVLLLLVLCAGAPAARQEGPPSLDDLQKELEQVLTSEDAAVAARKADLEDAIKLLREAADERRQAATFERDAAQAPAKKAAAEAELAKPASAPPELAPDLPTRDLEQRLRDAQSALETTRGEVDALAKEQAQQQERQAALPEELARIRQELPTLEERLATLPADADSAERAKVLAELENARARLARREARRAKIEAERDLAPLQRERARRRAIAAEELVTLLQDRVTAARKRDAEAAAAEAARQRRETVRSFPALADLASANEQVARTTTDLPARTDEVLRARDEIAGRLAELRRRFRSTRRRVAIGGLSEGMGEVLRRDYEWLPDLARLRTEATDRRRELSETLIQALDYQERVQQLGPLSAERDTLIRSLELAEPDAEVEELATKLLENQRAVLEAAIEGHDKLAEALYEWQAKHDELVEESSAYGGYIAERILWVRSTPPNCLPSFLALPRHAAEVLTEGGLEDAGLQLSSGLQRRAGRTIVWALLAGLLVIARRGLLARRTEIAEMVRFHRTDRFRLTLQTTLQCAFLAAPVPLILYAVGDLWHDAPTNLVHAVGTALRDVASISFVLGFVRRVAQEKSLGDTHFRWSSRSMSRLRLELAWFTPTVLPLALVSETMRHVSRQSWNESIGRVAFVAAMVALSVLAYRLQREGGALGPARKRATQTFFGRAHRLWSMLAIATPLALLALTLSGYTYTAEQFELRVRETLLLVLGLVLVRSLLFRWLFLVRRKLAVEQARAKARARVEAASGEGETPSATIDEDEVDIPAVDQQTQRLFKNAIAIAAVLGLFFLWADVLPALRGLERVQLYPSFEVLADADDARVVAEIGEEAPTSEPEPLDLSRGPMAALAEASSDSASETAGAAGATTVVTLGDLVFALLIVLLTGTAAKNLPGLLEISLLQRLPLDGGSRYAISTLLRYVIVIVGVSAAASAVGLGWNKVQWLAAALTFGLAFGLQEIFANFVSGLIILIERPVRVGDFVTVGGTDGRVTRVRMRATTVQDWDRRELLIPNKEFITSPVINWTLSDPITRLVIPVGVAYGSDTELVHQKLLQAAEEEPLVGEEPAPHVLFRAFGASSLDFELRVFIANREQWVLVTDHLHMRIDALFRECDIEISFPQRDLHVRSAPGLEALLKVGAPDVGPAS